MKDIILLGHQALPADLWIQYNCNQNVKSSLFFNMITECIGALIDVINQNLLQECRIQRQKEINKPTNKNEESKNMPIRGDTGLQQESHCSTEEKE